MHNHKNSQKGFTILVAVVTAGILLIVAMSIGGIALKEQVLSTANKESQTAFYAADTGMECAMYWDLKEHRDNVGAVRNIFYPIIDTGGNVTYPTIGTTVDIKCGGSDITTDVVNITNGTSPIKYYTYTFKVPNLPVGYNSTAKTCAIVKIIKTTGDSSIINGNPRDPSKTYTDIYSYGYNTCDASLTRLERGIEGHY